MLIEIVMSKQLWVLKWGGFKVVKHNLYAMQCNTTSLLFSTLVKKKKKKKKKKSELKVRKKKPNNIRICYIDLHIKIAVR